MASSAPPMASVLSEKDVVTVDGVPVYYNGIPTVQAKTRLALERAG